MLLNISRKNQNYAIDIESAAGFIAKTQRKSGEIPWVEGEKTDPWDHVEAAMGLSIGGYLKEAQRAYEWMARMQLSDGSWYTSYRAGIPEDKTRDTNMSSYLAVGTFHYYMLTDDTAFLNDMWETIRSAIWFSLSLQAPSGEIYWAISPEGKVDPMALLSGSSSIYMSIKCALAIAERLGHHLPEWEKALKKLENAIKTKPYLFNMTKSRYAMDWYYPILSGVITGEKAQKRIDKFWKKFIAIGQGARCVSDQPWVTLAETSELALAVSAMGNTNLSEIIFNWILDKQNKDGSYWCGFTCPDMTIWPKYKTTWTNAAVLMAADAIYELTPASQLFSHQRWKASSFVSI